MFILQLLRTGTLTILFLPHCLNSLEGLSLVFFTVFCVQRAWLYLCLLAVALTMQDHPYPNSFRSPQLKLNTLGASHI